ncbi:hypothetical protein BT96DRAFT_981800 [Gymnopus androsaceus JB14]|uniref:G domain-containing protein n=1 Tax=Gymnopus androsaceus JB14 TaxID=1447944 RepID=A0A6A4GLT7_9AGAR|nr:hypothetical protein BT96DRAFT_981800 [Gymnopus androsaceus JB14]
MSPSTNTCYWQGAEYSFLPNQSISIDPQSGAGKSALINRVFGISDRLLRTFLTDLTHVVIHDSEGFEHGDDGKRKIVEQFVENRLQMVKLAERLHAIWVCLEIPWSNGRLLDRGIEQFLESISGRAPVVVVFTKLDLLEGKSRAWMMMHLKGGPRKRSTPPLRNFAIFPSSEKINHDYPFIAVSNLERHADRIGELMKLTLAKCDVESAWVAVAIPQRAEAVLNIKASTRIGRKRYWRGLFSDVFIGLSVQKLITVLCKDIVTVWNLNDRDELLLSDRFLERLTVLVEDLSSTSQPGQPYHLTSQAVNAVVNNPTVFPVTVPVAVVVFLAEWVLSSYKKTKESLRCLMGFIIDLMLVMDALFYLTRDRTAVSIRHINRFFQESESQSTSGDQNLGWPAVFGFKPSQPG